MLIWGSWAALIQILANEPPYRQLVLFPLPEENSLMISSPETFILPPTHPFTSRIASLH